MKFCAILTDSSPTAQLLQSLCRKGDCIGIEILQWSGTWWIQFWGFYVIIPQEEYALFFSQLFNLKMVAKVFVHDLNKLIFFFNGCKSYYVPYFACLRTFGIALRNIFTLWINKANKWAMSNHLKTILQFYSHLFV